MPEGLGIKKLMKTVWYPQPHLMENKWGYELDDATIDATIYPIIMHDEGLGAPGDLETNPENASFVRSSAPNCYPDSRVNDIYGRIVLSLTSKALDENLPAVKVGFMMIKMSFDDEDKTDPLSTFSVGNILETQDEDTDNQRYPLWNGTKMALPYLNSGNLHANVPGLTTNQAIEGVSFNISDFYNTIHYTTIADKVKNCQRGLKWYILSKRFPTVSIPIHQDPKTTRINKKTLLAALVTAPVVDSAFQSVHTSDITSATQYVTAYASIRYNEWHEKFYNGRT